MKLLLQLLVTLPVTLVTLECTLTTLKLWKSYLRSTMNEEKLNGIFMTMMNKSEEITEAEVIPSF